MAGDAWTETTLGAIALGERGLVDGPFGSNLPASTYTPYGIPVIRGSNLSLGECRFFDQEFVFVSGGTAAQLARSACVPGDVVFTKKGTIGQAGFVPLRGRFERYLLSSNQMKLSVDPAKADSLFIYYVVSSPAGREKILRDASVTGVPKTNVAYLRNFPIRLPPLPEQRAIAYILGTLDDKIELNRRMNETLEAMARALFKAWFVDFEPVRAKMEGRWRRGESLPGLPAHLHDLFPNRLVDSELGDIPEGWSVATLSDFAALNPETWSKDTAPDEIVYMDLANTKWGKIESTTKYRRADAPSRAQRVLRQGDTIVGTVRPGNGSYALIGEDGMTGSTGFAVLRPRRPEFRELVYLTATAKDNVERLAHLADGAAYPAVHPEVVSATAVVKSPTAVIEHFSSTTNPLLDRIIADDRESRTLASLRDVLLPKLISGEIRIKDAERLSGSLI